VLVEQGSHEALMLLGGLYAELHNAQFEQPLAETPPVVVRSNPDTKNKSSAEGECRTH